MPQQKRKSDKRRSDHRLCQFEKDVLGHKGSGRYAYDLGDHHAPSQRLDDGCYRTLPINVE